MQRDMVLRQASDGLWQIESGLFASNCYVHSASSSSACVLIDPGLDPEAIDGQLTLLKKRPSAVLCTHGHFDHIGGAAYFQQKYRIPVYLPYGDVKTMESSNFLMMLLKIPKHILLPEVTLVVKGNSGGAESISAGGTTYRYLPCAGHTPGSCIISTDQCIFSGDSLFARGVGLSNLPNEDRQLLRINLLSFWASISASMLVCPGHGPTAQFGDICSENLALLEYLRATD